MNTRSPMLNWLLRGSSCGLSAALVLALAGCAQLMQLQPDQLASLAGDVKHAVAPVSVEEEEQIGQESAAVLLGASPPVNNPAMQAYVNRVGRWVALHSDRPDLPWQFAVLDDNDIDAYAAPGGYVFITKGLLLRLHSEAELAGVLGHEITHVVRKHHLNEIRRDSRLALVGTAAQLEMQQHGYNSQALAQIAAAAKLVYSRGLDKDDEFQADREGVVLAARSGYDPYALLEVLQMLQSIDPKSSKMALLLKTHPSPAARIAALSEAMQAGDMERYGNQVEGTERFASEMREFVAVR
ncbi:MAG TPA: M48 family metallopeptidase [Gammaproteobacteria bacterium]|nr:M48 family metallopeptidase [Gammaproteobacteria bacterium]